MASLKVYTRQDKAAFLNHLGKNSIQINSADVEDIQKDNNSKSYFVVHNLDDVTIDKIKDIFKGHPDMDVTKLKEMLRRIIREELKK